MMNCSTVLRKRAVVSHINLWPLREHSAATRDDLRPWRWCMTRLAGWVLGQALLLSPNEVNKQSMSGAWLCQGCRIDPVQHMGCERRAGQGCDLHTGHSFAWTPLTLFPYTELETACRRGAERSVWHNPASGRPAPLVVLHICYTMLQECVFS